MSDPIASTVALAFRLAEAGDLHAARVRSSVELWRQDVRALGVGPAALLVLVPAPAPCADCEFHRRVCHELADKLTAANRSIESLRAEIAALQGERGLPPGTPWEGQG